MWPWRKSAKRGSVDPTRPHPFYETNDAGIGAFASGGSQPSESQRDMLAVTTAYLRSTRCALPGCGKARQDLIHSPAD